MEACKQKLIISKENDFLGTHPVIPQLEVFCIEGKGHPGQHQANFWTNGYNRATGRNGIIKYIQWDTV